MRSSTATGFGLLTVALVAAGVIVIGLYVWDSSARAAEAALRPLPVAPLAVAATPTVVVEASTSIVPTTATLSAGDAASGARVFATSCNSCHPNANAGIGPALYGAQFTQRYPEDAQIVAVIRQGKGGMPAFDASELTDQQLADVDAYLHGLGSGAIAPEATPTPRPRQRGG